MTKRLRPLQVAVIGSGPGGLYTADALTRKHADARIDIFEMLPTPFGLIRSGVAPDHPGTKAVIRQFGRLLGRQETRFIGNVRIGEQISLDAMRAAYDLVFVATGAPLDRSLGIPGENLDGVYGSAAITGWYNGHPSYAQLAPRIGEHVAIIGTGNVALDIARVLSQSHSALLQTDMPDYAIDHLRVASPKRISLFGRSGLEMATFSALEFEGLDALDEVSVTVESVIPAAHHVPSVARKLDAMRNRKSNESARVQIRFAFDCRPLALEGRDRVEHVYFENGDRKTMIVPVDTVITAIGFQSAAIKGLNIESGRIACDANGRIAAGLYAVGWAKRGPSGTIPTNRTEARHVVECALAELAAPKMLSPIEPNSLSGAIDWKGWQRIESRERSAAGSKRPQKLANFETLLAVARGIPI